MSTGAPHHPRGDGLVAISPDQHAAAHPASPHVPADVPDAWRLDGRARVKDEAGDTLTVHRYGDRLEMWTSRGGYNWNQIVVLSADSDPSVFGDLRAVVGQIQQFLKACGVVE